MAQPPTRFEKWEGLGNDFVLVEGPFDPANEVVARACDRRRGIGADGLIVVGRSPAGDPTMVVRNADGSRPEMCGNGLRCVAGYLRARGAGDRFVVTTDAGPRACQVSAAADGTLEVTVDMGSAHRDADLALSLEGRSHRFSVVDVGNPHAITFDAYTEAEIDRVGPAVSVVPPAGINVEFCRDEGECIRVVVHERGVGRTLACGTGACAVAFVAAASGRRAFDVPMRIALPGGELVVTVAREGRRLTMRGPAKRVFMGEMVLG